MDVLQKALHARINELAAMDNELECEAESLREILAQPPRIVVIGRLKAGKSTLVNALIGAPVSQTAALEATNVVTVFHNGAPDRAEAVLKDGSRIPITTMRGQHTPLPVDGVDIAYVNRWMTSAAVAEYSLIDTPGLATLTQDNENATRNALLTQQTRAASVDADAAIFLFDSVPRKDEVEFLHQLGFTPLNTLGVLSRADSFGQGALGESDPLEHAAAYSQHMIDILGDYFAAVMPVAGLLAETAYTGRVSESLARRLAGLDGVGLSSILATLTQPGHSADKDALKELAGVVGEYGLFKGRRVAKSGGAALSEWLVEKSNLENVRHYLTQTLAPFADLHRAGRVVGEMERLSYRYPDYRNQLRSMISRLRNDPAMTSALLLQDLKSLLEVKADKELLDEVIRIIGGRSHGQKLGLGRFASGYDIIEAVRARRAWLDGYSLSFTSAAEEAAILNLRRIYADLERAGQALT